MPEPNFLSLYSFTPEPPKKAPVIKLSCGIGDTDGFPAFDVDSEQYAAKDDSKWGFLITGGAEFHMPLTVFQVTPDGLADKGGICLGDIILEINEEDATHLTLAQAHEKIDASGKKIHFLVKSMDDEEPMDGYEPGEERSIVLRVPKPLPPPKVSSIEKRLQDLQRKLSEIAEIPKILSSTLATVSQTFDKLTTNLPPSATSANCRHHCQSGNDYCVHFDGNEQKRKMSYDEDVYDYELSDEADGGDTAAREEFDAKETYLQLKRYAARHRKSKEETPESDYASESNYPQKKTPNKKQDDVTSDNDADSDESNDVTNDDYNYDDNNNDNNSANATFKAVDGDDDSDVENGSVMYENFNLSVLKIPLGHVDQESDTDEYEEDDDDEEADNDVVGDDDVDDDEDFLTTTFTWNLRNKPKLHLNDSNDNDNINKPDNDNNNNNSNDDEDDDKFNVSQEKSLKETKDMLCQRQRYIKSETPEREQKLDKLERSWPWADREKIIYKQSTCHLVPQKPLGLIEQRIQLLAKRNLLEHLNKTKNP